MKKKSKKIIECLLSVIMLFFSSLFPIYAQNEITFENPYGMVYGSKWSVQFTQAGNWGGTDDYYARFYINGQKVYCIEPLTNAIYGSSYTTSDLPTFTGSQALAKRLEYISALGYGFNGDYSDEMDFATQIRIWQEVLPGIVNTSSIHSDIQAKINEINNRLSILDSNISFNQTSVILQGYGQDFAQTVTDTSGSFSNYLDYSTSGIHTIRDGNSLTIWAEKGDNVNTDLIYDCLYLNGQAGTSIAYASSYSQNVAYLRGADPKACVLNVSLQLGSIQLSKTDLETNSVAQGEATFEGAEFDVVDNITNQSVGTLTSIQDGSTNKIEELPTDRTYTITETKAPVGYQLNETAQVVDFSNMDVNEYGVKEYNMPFTDSVITGKIKLKKVITDGSKSEIVTPEKNAEFIVVAKKYVDTYGSIESAYEHIDEMSIHEYDDLITNKKGNAVSKDLAYGTYVIKQISGQEETDILENEFICTIDKQGQTLEYTVNNIPTQYYVRIVKKDKDSNKNITLNSAYFKIKDADGNYVTMKVGGKTYDTFTTSSDHLGTLTVLKTSVLGGTYCDTEDVKGTVVTPLTLSAGNYTLEEISAPYGYTLSSPVSFTISKSYVTDSKDKDSYIEVDVKDSQLTGTLNVSKTINTSKKADTNLLNIEDLSGIEFTLTAKEDIQSVCDGSILYSKGDVVGTYLTNQDGNIQVDHLPIGFYQLQETKTLDGLVLNQTCWDVDLTSIDNLEVSYSIENKATLVEFSKTDVTGQEELEGAKLTVKDSDGNTMDEWTSTKETHIIQGLIAGNTYTLEEINAQEGYIKASNIQFKVLDTCDVQKVQMIDSVIDVSKEDVAGNEIEGAQMSVTDSDGNIVDSWTSTKESHKVKNLEEGKSYVLHEMASPNGYVVTNDIEFYADNTKNQHIVMIDKKLSIEKVDQLGNAVKNAKLQILDLEGNVVEEFESGDVYDTSKLKENETYILHECEVPDSYLEADDIEFTVNNNPEDQTIIMVDTKVDTISITKYDATNEKELPGAKLKVIDKDGKIVDEWTSTNQEHKIEGLIVGNEYTLIEITAPDGYEKAESIIFKVEDNGTKVQKVKMYDKSIAVVKTEIHTNLFIFSLLSITSLAGIITIMILKKRA